MAKRDLTFKSIFKIFFKGIHLYLINFDKFIKYMSFPVLGQVIGIIFIFSAAYLFTLWVPELTTANSVFDNILFVFLLLLFMTLPGFFIFCKAFWDYLVAMAALNSMASYIIESKNKLEDTSLHTSLILNRAFSYILFLLLITVIFILGSFPLLWALLVIAFVYISLSFQAFALEEDKSAFEAIVTSINTVKSHFWKTAFLLLLLGTLTYWLIPALICWGIEEINILGVFSYPVERFITLLPLSELNSLLSESRIPVILNSVAISKTITLLLISFVITAFTLPLRSICCTMLYRDLRSKNYAGKIAAEKLVKKTKKAAEEKE